MVTIITQKELHERDKYHYGARMFDGAPLNFNQPLELAIRIATSADANAIANLVNAAYRGDTGRRGWTTESDILSGQRVDQQSLMETLQEVDSVILLAVTSVGEIRGCVHVKKNSTEVSYLGMLTAAFDGQTQGIGSRLLSAAEDFAKSINGAKSIEMTVIESRTELIDWYCRRGYQETGEKRPFPEHDERFGIPLVKGIRFSVLQKQLGR